MARTPENTHHHGDRSNRKPAKRSQPEQNEYESLAEYDDPGVEVEPFVPTDVFPSTEVRVKRHRPKKKRRALSIVLLVVGVILLAVGGVFAYENLVASLPNSTLWFIAAGGLIYSLGVIFSYYLNTCVKWEKFV